MTSNPAWHNIFRYVVLKPDNITLEADTYKDTLTILRGPGVNWGGASSNLDIIGSSGNDTFSINVDYSLTVPLATTELTLEDVNGNLRQVNFKAGRGMAITRNSAQELQWDSYAVTETDTLHTVTTRNNITTNGIFINNLQVGTIASNYGEDGFTSYTPGHDLIGNGILSNPMQYSPYYMTSIAANNTEQFTFTATGPGTLAYSAGYVFDTGATTGSVTLERQNPSTLIWSTIDITSGQSTGISYAIQGIYAELYTGSVNYRLTYSWTVNGGMITWFTRDTFEGGVYSPINQPQIKTDTTAKTVDINDLHFIENTISTTVSNADVVIAPHGTGRLRVLGDIEAQNLYVDGNITIGDGVGTDVLTINSQFTAGTQLKTTQSNGNTLNISAYDVNDTIYRNLITLTASNTPTLTLISNGVGSIDNMNVGSTTAASGAFTTLSASSTVSGTGFSTYLASPPAIGSTAANTGAFTTLSASSTVSGTGFSTYLASPPAIGSTAANTGAFTTLSASSTVSGTGFSTYLASPPAIGGTAAAAGTFTSLTANGVITHNTTTNNQSYTTSGAGTITITSGTTGGINNMNIGASTAGTGAFTTLSASSTVSGTGFSTYLASPPAIGSTAANTGAFTTLSASSTVSGTGFSTYLASPPAIGSTSANTGAFTTLSASSTVSGTGFSTYLASPPAIGGTAAAAGTFTSLTATGAITHNTTTNNQSYTTTGAGTITITSGTVGNIDNIQIGNTTAAAGKFTTLSASSTVSGTGFSTYLASPPAIGSTAANTGAFTTLSASSTVSGTGFSTYLASPPAIGSTAANTGKFTTVEGTTSVLSSGTGGVGYSTGAGGTGSQSTAKTDTVTINKPTGQITMNAAALNTATVVSFTLSNTTIAATDHVVVTHVSGGTVGAYTVTANAAASSATVYVRNNTAGSLSEALVLRFSVIKSVNA